MCGGFYRAVLFFVKIHQKVHQIIFEASRMIGLIKMIYSPERESRYGTD